ncbi:MAG: acyl-CoA thioesterase [Nocardioides sp.]
MAGTVTELVRLLDLEEIDDNLFRGLQPDTERKRVFGGQVAAQALVAATRTIGSEFAAHSLHSYFLLPGDTAMPIVYDVERLREGRSFATRRVIARQHGRPIYYQTVNFQKAESGFDHQDPMPAVGGPESGVDLGLRARQRRSEDLVDGRDEMGDWEREWAAVEIRMLAQSDDQSDDQPDVQSGAQRASSSGARAQWWFKVAGELPDEPVTQRAAFTYASDMTLLGATLLPHGVDFFTPGLQVASLDHALWFHRPFRADRWWLYDQTSPSASGGRGLAFGRIFTPDGTLVASVAQEGLIRQRRPVP